MDLLTKLLALAPILDRWAERIWVAYRQYKEAKIIDDANAAMDKAEKGEVEDLQNELSKRL